MLSKTLSSLEYDKVLSAVSSYAVLLGTKQRLHAAKPFSDMTDVITALNKTDEAFKLLFDYGVSGIEFFDEPSDELSRAEKGSLLSLSELLRAARLLKSSRIIRDSFTGVHDESITVLPRIAANLYYDKYLEQEIFAKVISDDKLADDASERLFRIRRKIKKLNDDIRDKLNSYITGGNKYLQENIVTMRGDRYVIPVKSEYRSKIKGFVHDQSATGSTVFIEPIEAFELNNELRVTIIEEANEVEEIVRDLSHKIGSVAEKLKYNDELVKDIDEYCARALYAYSQKATRPLINVKGDVDIKRGRHPLIAKDKVVPIDVKFGGSDSHYLLITGPNTGGKTVTLKLVGLFTLMAASGMFLPCGADTKISLFDEIFCDIGDEQSIEQSLSTFSSHMKNLIDITENVNGLSLVLIDEIGAGTDPDEGSALAQAIIEKLIDCGSYGIITTHYSRLKEYAYVKDGILNASMDFDSETFAPLYKLNIGTPGMSNAIEIASRLGLGGSIVSAATSLLSDNKVSFENVLREAENTRKTAERERRELLENLQKSRDELNEIRREKEKLDIDKANLFAQAKAESRRIINEKVNEADEIIEKLKDILDKEEVSGGDIITARTLRNSLESKKYAVSPDETPQPRLNKCDISKLKVGDKVYVSSVGSYGTVQSANPKKGECFVSFGNMRLAVRERDLYTDDSCVPEKQTPSVSVKVEREGGFKNEINVIGLRREEAIDAVSEFIDSAVVYGATELRIVHGKGQKILRSAVHDTLRNSKAVKSYRLGKYGEGEDGVTIVTMK